MLNDLRRHNSRIKTVIIVMAAAVLVVGVIPLLVHFFWQKQTTRNSHVSLGALEYNQSNDRLVKRTDDSTNELRAFLTRLNDASGCADSTYHNVIAASPDEQQILLNYGCGYPNARMFAVKQNGEWKRLSPTNQFDQFGIPRCAHVDANHISRTIAPVCVEEAAGTDPRYVVR